MSGIFEQSPPYILLCVVGIRLHISYILVFRATSSKLILSFVFKNQRKGHTFTHS